MEMSAVLLSIFFTTGVSQNGFNVILKFTDLKTKSCNVPKRFDDCVKILLKDNNDTIKDNKTLYCVCCQKKVILEKICSKQRNCKTCKTK
jgi:hypothetical protein